MTPHFKKNGAALVANGYAIIPIPQGTKGPKIPNWLSVAPRSTDEFEAFVDGTHEVVRDGESIEVKNVSQFDGIGIVTRWTPAIDLDLYSEDMALSMGEFVVENLGDSPLRIGQAPKRLYLFRTSKPFSKITSASFIDPRDAKKRKQRIEVLGDGQQFVAYHRHPDTGREYEWPEDWMNPLDVAANELIEIDEGQARAICREFERRAVKAGWEKVGESRENDSSAGDLLAVAPPPSETEEEVARVKSSLEHISADCTRDEYLAVLVGLKWTGWLCAEEIAIEWAQKSEQGKFDESDFARDWKSLKAEKGTRTITLASIYGMAKKNGWDSSRKVELTPEEEKAKFEELLSEVEGIKPDDRDAQREALASLANASLNALDEAVILKAFAKKAKVTIADVKRALRETKSTIREHSEPTHANYARKLLQSIEERTGVEAVGVEGKLWVYNTSERIWIGKTPNEFEVEVAKAFDGMENCCRRNDYLAIANHAYSIACAGREDFFTEAPIGMACDKRFYTVEDGEIKREDLAARHRQRVVSEITPKVGPTPMWDKLMAAAFKGDHDREQEMLLEEYAGACLLGVAYRFERVLLMKGVGRAGKGTILKILSSMVPREATASIPPEKWAREYYLADLAGKRLNIVGELSEDIPIDSASFKSVVGRDPLTARHPTHRPFQFTNMAGHVFNSNFFIFTKDHTEAFYARWLLMEFRNSLIGKDDEIDPNLADKIIESELPGVAAKLLQGAKRLMERGNFKTTGPHHKLMSEWRHRSSTLMEFIYDSDVCVLGEFPDLGINRAVFYGAYAEWCRESNRKPLGKQKLYDEIESTVVKNLGIRFVSKAGNSILIRGIGLRSMMFNVEAVDDDL